MLDRSLLVGDHFVTKIIKEYAVQIAIQIFLLYHISVFWTRLDQFAKCCID